MFIFRLSGTTSKRKNSLSICTDDPPQPQQQRKKREKVGPLSLLQQIDYKPQQARKNELEFLASLIAKNAPATLTGGPYEQSLANIKKDAPTTSILRCDKCFFSFHTKEQLITHKCINQGWMPPHPPSSTHHRLPPLEKHQPLHRPVHVSTPYGSIDAPPASSISASHYHSYYQNLSYAYPSPPMEPHKNFNGYKSTILPLKNF